MVENVLESITEKSSEVKETVQTAMNLIQELNKTAQFASFTESKKDSFFKSNFLSKKTIELPKIEVPNRNLNLLIKTSCIEESNSLIEDRVAALLLTSHTNKTVTNLIDNKWTANINQIEEQLEHRIDVRPNPTKNQDNSQKFTVMSTLLLELYRVITSSLLILFVPQSCKGQLCTIQDNLKWNPNHHVYNYGICLNFITLFVFSGLYYIELKRENRLIKYLDVNPDMPSSNLAVQKTLEIISLEKRNKILSIDKQYQRISYISIGIFIMNSVSSAIIVNRFYLGSQTTTTLITSLLFMFSKLYNVYQVTRTEEHIFYSAYMKTFVQFNDLDETYKHGAIL